MTLEEAAPLVDGVLADVQLQAPVSCDDCAELRGLLRDAGVVAPLEVYFELGGEVVRVNVFCADGRVLDRKVRT